MKTDDSSSGSDVVDDGMHEFNSDQCCSTELTTVGFPTTVEIKRMEEEIEAMKQQIIELKKENASLKFTLSNIADNDKKSFILYRVS